MMAIPMDGKTVATMHHKRPSCWQFFFIVPFYLGWDCSVLGLIVPA